MAKLYNRSYTLSATSVTGSSGAVPAFGNFKSITGLRIKFSIQKTSKSSANKSIIEIFNLNPSSRAFFEKKEDDKDSKKYLQINLEAGYEGLTETIFSGNVVNTTIKRSGNDTIVKLECGDGQKALDFAHVDKTYSKGTPVQAVIADLMNTFQFQFPDSVNKAPSIPEIAAADILQSGFTVSGSPKSVLDEFGKSLGFSWSIQDGKVIATKADEPTPDTAVSVSSSTGLIGTVEPTDDGIKFKTLLNPGIKPGRLIILDPLGDRTLHKVLTASYTGDTHGGGWYIMVEAKTVPALSSQILIA